jgi:hypothetical protein
MGLYFMTAFFSCRDPSLTRLLQVVSRAMRQLGGLPFPCVFVSPK